jgi:hypothetical protein
MQRRTWLPLMFLAAVACQDALPPSGEPNIRVVDGSSPYGDLTVDTLASKSFFFRSPIVPEPDGFSGRFNPYLNPTVEIWDLGVHRDSVYKYGDDHPQFGTPYGCTSGSLVNSYTGSAIHVDAVNEKYELGWNTSDDLSDEDLGYVFRVCVTVSDPFVGGEILLGYRDVSPDANGADIPRDGDELPIYQFNLGRNLPVKFWIGGDALCLDAEGNVIDCVTVTLDANGGTATCNDAQCGIYVPAGAIPVGQLATFEVRYVTCDAYNADNTVEYLDIDIPQYFGCLEVSTVATYDWTSYDGLGPGITIASCRDTEILGPQDERLLLHIESKVDVDADNRLDVYALPTRPFELECDTPPPAPSASASLGDWAAYYLKRGTRAATRALMPLIAPRELNAAHSGFGGGTSLKCSSSSGVDGPNAVTGCSTPSLASGASGPSGVGVEAGDPVTFRAVWALPSEIKERLQVVYDEFGNPSVIPWMDVVAGSVGGEVYPAVRVQDECKPDPDPFILPDGTTHIEDCADALDAPRDVEGAWVTFTFFDANGQPYNLLPKVRTGRDGIATAPWPLPTSGTFQAFAGGLGIGVHDTLTNYAVDPPVAGANSFQDHIGNVAVPLETPLVRFVASACSDKSEVLSTQYVDGVYGAGIPIPINVSSSDANTAYLYVTNDCNNVYFALEIPQSQDLQNALRVVFVDQLETRFTGVFDPMHPARFAAVPEVGDDMWFIARDADRRSSTYGEWLIDDWHVSDECTGSSKQSECGRSDPVQNLLAPDGAVYTPIDDLTATVYEFARCFPGPDNPTCTVDPNGYDFYVPDVGGSTWIGFYLVLQGGKGAQGNTEYPDFRVFQPIEIVRQ